MSYGRAMHRAIRKHRHRVWALTGILAGLRIKRWKKGQIVMSGSIVRDAMRYVFAHGYNEIDGGRVDWVEPPLRYIRPR